MRRVAYAVPCILLVAMRLFNALFAFLSLCFLSFYELDLARCRLVRRHVLLFFIVARRIGAFFCSGRFRCAKVFASVLLSAVNSCGHGGSSVDLQTKGLVCSLMPLRLLPPRRAE